MYRPPSLTKFVGCQLGPNSRSKAFIINYYLPRNKSSCNTEELTVDLILFDPALRATPCPLDHGLVVHPWKEVFLEIVE
jgi:hypothetical protein